ncbi:DnaJ-domain-containing protein [Delitschia confertaspora ATCC 74209]|uniref:DnaJ-domain-containing protein n=1 Tax=Delitschia confertaspora ATCC 74209 TaxID=1513339 RepID=A0A9P4MX56_9PLEO|nr:DnaJ-domain-containing protein [Delitschia confertaspora ATCC 74209]
MQVPSHYEVLGLAHTAPISVIRAAYKALALEYHPDKQKKSSPASKNSLKSRFLQIQEAHEVLTNSIKRAAYDMELSKPNSDFYEFMDDTPSKSSASSKTSTMSGAWASSPISSTTTATPTPGHKSSHHRTNTIYPTPQATRDLLRAKADKILSGIHAERARREAEELETPLPELKDIVRIWKALAEENKHDTVSQAHCVVKIHEYEGKVAKKEQEHTIWLKGMAIPRNMKDKMDNNDKHAARAEENMKTVRKGAQWPSFNTPTRFALRAEEKRKAEEQCSLAKKARAEARQEKNAKNEAMKLTDFEAKRQFSKADKEELQKNATEIAKNDADRIRIACKKAVPQIPKVTHPVISTDDAPSHTDFS